MYTTRGVLFAWSSVSQNVGLVCAVRRRVTQTRQNQVGKKKKKMNAERLRKKRNEMIPQKVCSRS